MARNRGRPTKFTDKTKEKLLQAIRAGMYFDTACQFADVDYRTFRYWMEKGEKAKSGDYFHFFHDVKKAESEAEARVIMAWQKAIPEDWKAAATFLERRYPERWGRRDRHEISGKDGGAIEIDVKSIRNEIIGRIDRIATENRTNENHEKVDG